MRRCARNRRAANAACGRRACIRQRAADLLTRFGGGSQPIFFNIAPEPLPISIGGAIAESGIVLGWQLAERIVPPLLDAGTIGDPEIGRAFLDRLMTLVTAPSIDLAVPHGGTGAPALDVIAAHYGIALVPMTATAIESAWAVGNLRPLRSQIEAHAIATWQLWLAESNGTAAAASEAFAVWLERRANTAG